MVAGPCWPGANCIGDPTPPQGLLRSRMRGSGYKVGTASLAHSQPRASCRRPCKRDPTRLTDSAQPFRWWVLALCRF